jgi:hypothetical protein
LLFAEIHRNPAGTKSRHQTAEHLLRQQQIAKSTRFAVETANSKSLRAMHLGLQQCV